MKHKNLLIGSIIAIAVGIILWIYFLSPSLKRGKNAFSVSDGIAGGTVSWILVCLGGILNPTLNMGVIFLLIWLFDSKR